ncbi:hypothetical protein J3A83DRAFT_4373774 [Scleroderma citrinum]
MPENKSPGKSKGRAMHNPATEDVDQLQPGLTKPSAGHGHPSDSERLDSQDPNMILAAAHPRHIPEHQRQRPSQSLHRSRRPNNNVPGVSSHQPRSNRSTSMLSPSERTMLHYAWRTVLDSDPLADSDEEFPDEHTRLDYARRIRVISRLRGKSSTPDLHSAANNHQKNTTTSR